MVYDKVVFEEKSFWSQKTMTSSIFGVWGDFEGGVPIEF